MKLKNYKPIAKDFWKGRIDDPNDLDTLRWHQSIKILNLEKADVHKIGVNEKAFCILGFACDKGVEKNLGRIGTAKGPFSIRTELANLPDRFSNKSIIYDAGNIYCNEDDLVEAQNALSIAVELIFDLGFIPIILGGGHEIAFGHYFGILNHFNKENTNPDSLGIINFNAHFDLRPTFEGASSGTMFRQIADDSQKEGRKFNYMCVGIQQTANTTSLFKKADELGANYIFEKDITEESLPHAYERVDQYTNKLEFIYLSICTDVFSSAFAPGVSSPQPFGMNPELALRIIKRIVKSGKVISFDIAEVSPRFDEDNRTAKLAAILIYAIINSMLNPGDI